MGTSSFSTRKVPNGFWSTHVGDCRHNDGAFYDAGARLFLWRTRQGEECHFDDDDVGRDDGSRRCAVGVDRSRNVHRRKPGRLLGKPVQRLLGRQRHERDVPRQFVCGIVRDHHGCVDFRSRRRPRKIRSMDGVRRCLRNPRVLPHLRLGVGRGWIAHLGESLGLPAVIDYAGGLAVEITSGSAALALALVLGKRVNFGKGIHQPHNVPLTLIGFGILFFGWFGFNAGAEAFTDMAKVGLISMNTFVAASAGSLGWMLIERLKDSKATSVGAASGAVAGLVAITPSCANLTPSFAILLGFIAGIACAYAIELKFKLGFDDSLDVVGIHLVGGLVGMIFLGFFATETGWVFSGNPGQLVVQVVAAVSVLVYSFVAALLIGSVIEKTMGFRASTEAEIAGIDTVVHGELGYALDED